MDLILKKYLDLRNVEEGQTLAEYALLLALIAIVVIVAVGTLGGRLQEVFESITTGLSGGGVGPE